MKNSQRDPFWSGLAWGGGLSLAVAIAGWFGGKQIGWFGGETEDKPAAGADVDIDRDVDSRQVLQRAVEQVASQSAPEVADSGTAVPAQVTDESAALDPSKIHIDEKAYRAKYVGREAELTKIGQAREYRKIDGQITQLQRSIARLESEGNYTRARELERDIIKLKVKRDQVADRRVQPLAP